MGEMAGSNRQQPETIAFSLTILELLLETGFICGLLCKIMLRKLGAARGQTASTQTRKEGLWVEVFDRSVVEERSAGSFDSVRLAPHYAQDDSSFDCVQDDSSFVGQFFLSDERTRDKERSLEIVQSSQTSPSHTLTFGLWALEVRRLRVSLFPVSTA